MEGSMRVLWSDLRFAVRVLKRTPGFSLAVIGALALGIGPNTAIFSIVYATLLAPLPFPDPDQLVMVWSQMRGGRDGTSPAEYMEWKRQATSFQYIEPFWPRQFNLATPEAPMRVRARQTSPDGYRMLGEGVWLGRDFKADEDQPGRNQVALLSHRLWQRLGSDRSIIGRDIRLDSKPYTVVGVLPAGPQDRLPADLWIPLSLSPEEMRNRQFRPLLMTGRLKTGVTIQQAQEEMNGIASRLAREFPSSNTGRTVSIEPLQNNFLRQDFVRNLWLLLAAVSFVLLIACVNVANLLLARGSVRRRETAIRASLGATGGRLLRLAVTESFVLAVAGGAIGVLSSVWILPGILAIMPRGTLPAEADPRLNLPVLLFTLATTMLCGLLFGSAGAWPARRVHLSDALKQAGRGTAGSGRGTVRHALVVVEFALAVTLLAGAGLTILSFWKRTQVDLGVRTNHVLTFGLPVHEGRFSSAAQMEVFYRQVVERLKSVPGVVQASVSAPGLPLLGIGLPRQFTLAGKPDDVPALRPSVFAQIVTPEFFETFGTRLVRGRAFADRDGPDARRVAVVNERFVKLFLEGRSPVGQQVMMDGLIPGRRAPGPPVAWEIVGVVGDITTVERFGDPQVPQLYVPFAQNPWPQAMAAVRAASDPEALRKGLAAAVHAVDPNLPLTEVQTMEQIVGERLAPDRLNIALYGGLAALALLLAGLGIYGVMAFAVAQRTSEIGLRIALGAQQSEVRVQLLGEGLRLAVGGLILGLAGAYGLGRAMQSTLYGTGALSLPVLLAVSVTLLGAALLACYVPARRASAVDPMMALRQE
jgi:putative ABC transport system permease protein